MTYRRCICHPDDLPGVGISSGWVTANSLCHPDDILFHFMSSGWLNWGWFLIRMSYGNVIMSSGWDTLPFLSHPDEIANFDFPQHAVALQRFRRRPMWTVYQNVQSMMTSSNGSIFRVTGLCAGNSPVTGEFPSQRRGVLMFSLICAWMNGWVNNNGEGDLRRHRAHYDVIAMGLEENRVTLPPPIPRWQLQFLCFWYFPWCWYSKWNLVTFLV